MSALGRLVRFRLGRLASRVSAARPRRAHSSGRAAEFLQCHDADLSESQRTVREAVARICRRFPDDYWLEQDRVRRFPTELHAALAHDGCICMPEAYCGAGLSMAEAAVMMQTVAESGGGMAAASVHMNIFGLEPVVRFGSDEQKARFLPPLIAGRERACFAVTELDAGLDTPAAQVARAARRRRVRALGAEDVDLGGAARAQGAHPGADGAGRRAVALLRRPGPRTRLRDRDGQVGRAAVDSNALLFDGRRVPAADRIGAEGRGFAMVLHGMNAERILMAAEALGLGLTAVRRAAAYAGQRVVFGRPIGQNQDIQHPLADAWMRLEAARLYDGGSPLTGEYANTAKYLTAEAAEAACERTFMTHGGMGYAREFHIERYLRKVMIPRLAPVSGEMICNYITQRVLGLPKSY